MPQVFGCPHCQNPFQVPDDAAGQTFQCPSCETPVEVPGSKIEEPPEPEIFECPHCSGQFGIDASMYGQQLTCPHCENMVAIGEGPNAPPPPPNIETETPVNSVDEATGISSQALRKSESAAEATEETDAVMFEEEPQEEDSKPEESPEAEVADPEPEPEPVFEPKPVDHLLPPTFNAPDPVRFPARQGDQEVFLPDGKGGYKKVDTNIVTITHKGEVYHLKRLTPQQRRRRSLIHNAIAIGVAVILIYFTLRTIGLLS